MDTDHVNDFEVFIEEVADILPLNTHNESSLQKSKNYLDRKIEALQRGKERFRQMYQIEQINMLMDEIRQIRNALKIDS